MNPSRIISAVFLAAGLWAGGLSSYVYGGTLKAPPTRAHAAWTNFAAQMGAQPTATFATVLKLDLNNPALTSKFVSVMAQTGLQPAELQDMPVAQQAAKVQLAVTAYAGGLAASAKGVLAAAQTPTFVTMALIEDLQVVETLSLLPEAQQRELAALKGKVLEHAVAKYGDEVKHWSSKNLSADGSTKLFFVGQTGAGKTKMVRQLLKSLPKEKLPAAPYQTKAVPIPPNIKLGYTEDDTQTLHMKTLLIDETEVLGGVNAHPDADINEAITKFKSLLAQPGPPQSAAAPSGFWSRVKAFFQRALSWLLPKSWQAKKAAQEEENAILQRRLEEIQLGFKWGPREKAALLLDLQSPDLFTRVHAMTASPAVRAMKFPLGESSLLDLLRYGLDGDDAALKWSAQDLLRHLAKRMAFPASVPAALAAALPGREGKERAWLVSALGRQETLPPEVEAALLPLLREEDFNARPRLALIALEHPDHEVGKKAAEAFRMANKEHLLTPRLQQRLDRLLSHESAAVRLITLNAFSKHDGLTIERLAGFMTDDRSAFVRLGAARILSARAPPGYDLVAKVREKALAEALKGGAIGLAAAKILAGYPGGLPAEAVPAVAKALAFDGRLILEALDVVKSLGALPEELTEPLTALFNHQDKNVRAEAAAAFAAIKKHTETQHARAVAALLNDDLGVAYNAYTVILEQRYRQWVNRAHSTAAQMLKSSERQRREYGMVLLGLNPSLAQEVQAELLANYVDGRVESWPQTAEVLRKLKNPAPLLQQGLLSLLKAQTDPARKLQLAFAQEKWRKAGALVDAVHAPAVAQELHALIPGLEDMRGDDFSESRLASPESAAALISDLAELKTLLTEEEYADMAAGFDRPVKVQPRYLLAAEKTAYKAGPFVVPYAVPGTEGSAASKPAVFASLDPGAGSEAKERLLKTFETFDALIDKNFQALGLLAKTAGKMDKASGLSVLDMVSEMAALYSAVAADYDGAKVGAKLKALREELEGLWKDLPLLAPLPKDAAGKVAQLGPASSIDDVDTLHSLINFIHQQSFKELSRHAKSASADGKLDTGVQKIKFLNMGQERLTERGRVVNPFLKLLAQDGLPHRGEAILKDDQLWYHARLGAHSVEVHVKLAEPDDGGLLQVRYSEGGDDEGNQLRLVYVSEILRLLGAPSEVHGNQFLNSSWDKDHGLASKGQLEDALLVLLRGLAVTGNLDWKLQGVERTHGMEEGRKAAKDLAELLAAEGRMPIEDLPGDTHNDMLLKGINRFRGEQGPRRDEARSRLNRELERLGLPLIPLWTVVGQDVVDRFFTRPVLLGLARGELKLDGKGLPQRLAHKPVEALAAKAANDELGALGVAALLGGAGIEGLDYEAIGGVGRLRAERGQLLWSNDEGLTVHVLRDPQTQAIVYASAGHWLEGKVQELGAKTLAALLEKKGLAAAGEAIPGSIQRSRRRRLLRLQPLLQDEAVMGRGLSASAGDGSIVTGKAAFRRDEGIEKGSIFIAPFTTPDDLEHMRRSGGVVTTGGGLLSHAGITTREMGLPAVILHKASWRTVDGRPALDMVIELPQQPKLVDGLWVSGRGLVQSVLVREGDVVRLDGAAGTLTVFQPEVFEVQEILSTPGAEAAAAAVAAIGRLRGPPRFNAAVFALEEMLLNPAQALRRDSMLAALFGLDAELAEELRRHGERLLSMRLAKVEERTEFDEDVTQADVKELEKDIMQLEELARTLRLPAAALDGLRSRLEEWNGTVQTAMRALKEAVGKAVKAWNMRLDSVQTGELPALRAALRTYASAGVGEELLEMRRKAEELASSKKKALLEERPSVIALDKVDDDFTELVGGKSAKLGEIAGVVQRAGGYVPGGVALTTEAYLRFLKESGLEEAVMKEASGLDYDLSGRDLDDDATLALIRGASERIRGLILSARLDPASGLGAEMLAGLADMPEGTLFAVRSSAVQEDSQEAAFAGAAESFMFVDREALLEKVLEGWASFWLPRGIQYRWQQGITSVEMRPAVTVQKMADVEAAGVLFTRNPVTGRREVLINAAFGMGEGIVSGLVQADQYVANDQGEELAPPVLGAKKVMVVRKAEGGTETRSVPPRERRKRALTPEQIRQLAEIGAALEDYFGYPLDIEFGIERGMPVILQARAITTRAGG